TSHLVFFVTTRRLPRSPLFPYTTLFRSRRVGKCLLVLGGLAGCEDEIVLLPENARLLGPNEVEVAAADQVLLRPPEHCAERVVRSEEHTSELQSLTNLVCRLLLEKTNRT